MIYFEKRFRKWQNEETRPGNPNNRPFPVTLDKGQAPFTVRFGDLKPKLQTEAYEKNISMHYLIRLIIDGHYRERNFKLGVCKKRYGRNYNGRQQLTIFTPER